VSTYGGSATGPDKTLVLHGNGSTVNKAVSPSPGLNDVLYNVSADSATDAWAVGWYQSTSNPTATLALHWNGTSWTKVLSPN
jgi:hypothetical protein